MGHPLGATGAMILGTVLDELERRDLNTALVTLCIGGGMGTATDHRTRLTGAENMSYTNFKIDIDADGIALVTWDVPGPVDERLHRRGDGRARRDRRRRSMADAAIKGAVITSGKATASPAAPTSPCCRRCSAVFADGEGQGSREGEQSCCSTMPAA